MVFHCIFFMYNFLQLALLGIHSIYHRRDLIVRKRTHEYGLNRVLEASGIIKYVVAAAELFP